MGKGLIATRFENRDMPVDMPAHLHSGSPPQPPVFSPVVDPGELLWKGMALLREQPGFEWITSDDKGAFWCDVHGHLSQFRQCRHGFVTIRTLSTRLASFTDLPTELAKGKRYHLMMLTRQKLADESEETPLYLFLTDLYMASRNLGLGEEKSNRTDQNRFVLFDYRNPAVRSFIQRFEL